MVGALTSGALATARGTERRGRCAPTARHCSQALVAAHLGNTEVLATSAGNLAVSLGRHLGPRVPRFLRELETGQSARALGMI